MLLTNDLIPTILPASIAFVGVLLSVFLSYLVSLRKLRLDANNLIESKKKAFNDLLQTERLQVYPEIYETISGFVKTFRTADLVPLDKLEAFNSELAKYDSKYGIFYSTNTTFNSAGLMQEVRKLIKENSINREKIESLFKNIGSYELSLKRDIGVFLIDSKDASNNKFVSYEELMKQMDEKMVKTWDI